MPLPLLAGAGLSVLGGFAEQVGLNSLSSLLDLGGGSSAASEARRLALADTSNAAVDLQKRLMSNKLGMTGPSAMFDAMMTDTQPLTTSRSIGDYTTQKGLASLLLGNATRQGDAQNKLTQRLFGNQLKSGFDSFASQGLSPSYASAFAGSMGGSLSDALAKQYSVTGDMYNKSVLGAGSLTSQAGQDLENSLRTQLAERQPHYVDQGDYASVIGAGTGLAASAEQNALQGRFNPLGGFGAWAGKTAGSLGDYGLISMLFGDKVTDVKTEDDYAGKGVKNAGRAA